MNETNEVPTVRRLQRGALLVALPLAALLAAWWFTRAPDGAPVAARVTAPATDGHDHAAMAGIAAGSEAPISLTADQARRIGVTFAPVTAGALATEVRTLGQVVVDESRVHAITLRFDGWVERLRVDRTGQTVRAGDPLMDVYSPMVVSAQEELLLARRLADQLGAGEGRARTDATDLVTSARRRLALWDVPEDEIARLERSGEVARTITPRATASGEVLEKTVVEGQRVMAGDVLYRIADLSQVWVEGDVYEQDLRAIAVGQSAVATFDAIPGASRTGRVALVYPTLSTETRTARVRIAFDNSDRRLRPGMFATLLIAGARRASALSVPRSAVLSTGERALVFVRAADGSIAPREVKVGASTDDRTEILSGVVAGETVVSSATFLVDAESNLRTALGGMGDMPGMEITTPPTSAPAKRAPR